MIETMTSLPPQAPTTATSATLQLQESSSTTPTTIKKDLGSMSRCTTASESPEVPMKTAQHSPASFATPDSDQRKVLSEVPSHSCSRVGVRPQTMNSSGCETDAKNVTPSSVVTITGRGSSSRDTNITRDTSGTIGATSGTSSVISSSPATSTSSAPRVSTSGQTSSKSIEVSRPTTLPTHHVVKQLIATKNMAGSAHYSISSKSNISKNTTSSCKSSAVLTTSSKAGGHPVPRNIKTEPMSVSRSQSEGNSKGKVRKAPKYEPRSTTPVPPTGARSQSQNFKMKTPVRSPKNCGSSFQAYNSELLNFGSPGIFLSPCLLSPPGASDKKAASNHTVNGKACGQEAKIPIGGITPTNFSSDFGKNDINDDALNNVLPWILSPNAYGLFSPAGGLTASITPSALSKPVMGTIGIGDTSKFALPFDREKRDVTSGGIMMCVSPLARKNGTAVPQKRGQTPINFNDVFASPKADERTKLQTVVSNEIPTISEQADEEAKLILEKHLAERDVMEDQDLNTLLKLAETTPRRDTDGKDSAGTRVFRGAGGAFAYPAAQPVGPPSFLHLPIIGKSTGSQSKRSEARVKSGTASAKKGSSMPKNRKNPKTKIVRPKGVKTGSHPNPAHANAPGMGTRPPPGYYPPPHYMHPAAVAGMHPAAAAGMAPYPYPYQSQPPHPPYMYPNVPTMPSGPETVKGLKKKLGVAKTSKITKPTKPTGSSSGVKRPITATSASSKRSKKNALRGRGPGKKKATPGNAPADKQKVAATISAINSASGKKNNKAASLASAVLRGVTMRPSGKWQAQLYFAGKSRYIGVFDSREKAALAYEIAREHLQNKSVSSGKDTDAHVNAARKAAFEGVNETDPRLASS